MTTKPAVPWSARDRKVLYDYERQAWVVNGLYVRCGHPETVKCGCYGRLHEGEAAR